MVKTDSTLASDVLYYSERGGQRIFIGKNAVSFTVFKAGDTALAVPDSAFRLDMQFVCTECDPVIPTQDVFEIDTFERTGDVLNFYLPHCQNGITGVPGYAGVTLKNLYSNTDVQFYSNGAGPSMSFVLKQGADPSDLMLRFDGQDSIATIAGALTMYIGTGAVIFPPGYAYQYDSVGNVYPLSWAPGWSSPSAGTAQLVLGSYDTTMALVIKLAKTTSTTTPLIGVEWTAYYGSEEQNYGSSVSNSGTSTDEVYMLTNIRSGSFPATVGQITNGARNLDMYLTRFNSNHSREWSTYLGGAVDDHGYKIEGGSGNEVYACGFGSVGIATYPVSGTFKQNFNTGYNNGVLAAFGKGNGIRTWLTYINGNGSTVVKSVYQEPRSGRLFVVGQTEASFGTSSCTNTPVPGQFPLCAVAGAYNQSSNPQGGNGIDRFEGFLMEFDDTTHQLMYSTLFGSTGYDELNDVVAKEVVFPSGGSDFKIFALGRTYSVNVPASLTGPRTSPLTNHYFPVTDPGGGAYVQNVNAGAASSDPNASNMECFLLALDGRKRIEWCTLFGGHRDDISNSIAINIDDNIYIGGFTQRATAAPNSNTANAAGLFPFYSSGTSFSQGPSPNPYGDVDNFFAGFAPNGRLIWSTFFRLDDGWEYPAITGAYEDAGAEVTTDAVGNLFFAGTNSRMFYSNPAYNASAQSAPGMYFQANNASIMENVSEGSDAYICMFRKNRELVWSTNYGGGIALLNPSPMEQADGIAVNSSNTRSI